MDQKNRLAIWIGVLLGLVVGLAIVGLVKPQDRFDSQQFNPFERLRSQMTPRAIAAGGLKRLRVPLHNLLIEQEMGSAESTPRP